MNQLKFISGAKEEMPARYLDQLFALMLANYKEILKSDPPEVEFYKKRWTLGTSSDKEQIFVLVLNQEDKVIGYGDSSWNIKYDNLDKAWFWVHITKDERRKGFGKQTLKKILEKLPPQITGIITEVFTETDGVPFVESLQMKKKYTEVLSRSDLTKFDPEEVKKESRKLKQQALEKGYEIIYIDNMNHVFHLDFIKYVEMAQEIWNDMPLEELTYEDEILSVDRYQEMIQRQILAGNHIMSFVAIHKETNEIAGVTVTYINKHQTKIAHQQDTGVVRAHRGKGLGLALKYQLLEKLLFETKAVKWQTGNAGSNEHMLRINNILNHKPFTDVPVYEGSRSDLLKRL
ncbi:MAG: GNAT family N-acetyltransferase [Candidatus Heimdallarchaeota archaeon]|nr:GNAT family N-acetyltransferase [Candidatus Heimdallarchaeota archaeon]